MTYTTTTMGVDTTHETSFINIELIHKMNNAQNNIRVLT